MIPVEEGKSYGEMYNNPCEDCGFVECRCETEIPDGQKEKLNLREILIGKFLIRKGEIIVDAPNQIIWRDCYGKWWEEDLEKGVWKCINMPDVTRVMFREGWTKKKIRIYFPDYVGEWGYENQRRK